MVACPVCKVECVERDQLFLSSRVMPLLCSNCKALLGIEGFFAGTYTAALEFLILGIGALVAQVRLLSTVFVLLCVWCGVNIVAGLFLSPVAISQSQVTAARWTVSMLGVIFLVFFVVAVYRA